MIEEKRARLAGRYGTLEVYEQYILGSMVDGYERFSDELFEALDLICAEYFRQPFGYISNRVHRNAADPRVHREARRRYPLWRSMAVVSYSSMTERFAHLETAMLGGMPFRIFETLDEAVAWTRETIGSLTGDDTEASDS